MSGMHTLLATACLVACLALTCHGASFGYKYCLYECSTCVQLWGDELYDGQRCATCCRHSDGVKVDSQCKVWTRNQMHYDKKDLDYVRGILAQKRTAYSDTLNYKYIFGEVTPDYCFGKR
ncbi:uncharacterized protein LOC127873817 [Dreissena polymorpha]|uniref:Uncharacterized protein n=1 Tax=Dreissena polymorpha TaxID=45954 RepID=A0A9D4KYR6_DREPO|nr:uncharacterized protein LOC127873817 [Dreissena polymorpha]KAH3848104.1 hypothetical protein DPMN_090453 [Dreissena polymorpha]